MLEDTIATLRRNLLEPAMTRPGTLRFGANVMQLDNYGAQVLTQGAAQTAFFFFDDRFQPNPNSPTNPSSTPFSAVVGITDREAAQPYSSVGFDSFSGTATSELKSGTEDDTNDNAYTQSYVNVGSDIATVRHDMDAGRTFAQLILSNTVLELASFTSDPGTLNNGDVWYRSDTGKLYARINGATISLGSGVATDAIWDAKGDLAVGTGADTAQKLTVGQDGARLVADSSATTGVAWKPFFGNVAALTGTGSTSLTSAQHYVRLSSLTGDYTVNLNHPQVAGEAHLIKRYDATGYTVTIDGNTTDTIDGSLTITLAPYESVLLVWDGSSNWEVN